MTGDLFGDARPVSETIAHGHRTTPAHVVRTLWAQPEFQARSVQRRVDLGYGAGAIVGEMHRLDRYGDIEWELIDIRDTRAAAWDSVELLPGCTFHIMDATRAWTASAPAAWWAGVDQVVSNPPWSIQRCPVCEATWEARVRRHCIACTTSTARVDGEDLAQVMVARAMDACQAADVWVIHTSKWRFHTERARFFLPQGHPDCTRPASHAFATLIEVAERVAWGDPSARGKVAPHNAMTALYHFAPVPATRADWHTRYRLLPTWEQ